MESESLIEMVRHESIEAGGGLSEFRPLYQRIGDARFVLLGEATHGSAEFYRGRSEVTRTLVLDHGFNAVLVEADWPDAYRVNRFVRGIGNDRTAEESLGDFRRFPTWMWRNEEVRRFVEWMRRFNETREPSKAIGFYGLDLYSLYASTEAVIDYLDRVDPEAASRARERYGCLDNVGREPQQYGHDVMMGLREACEEEVVQQLRDLQQNATRYLSRNGMTAADEQFQAEQNARLVRDAEDYYRAMFRGGVNTWNLRDRHMLETIAAMAEHYRRQGIEPRFVIWTHNSHVGDARATLKSDPDEITLGQLARQRFGTEAVRLVGMTTFSGTVTAASCWGGDPDRKRVRPALPGSYEALFHFAGLDVAMLPLENPSLHQALDEWRLERAIGVIYLPQTERASHYYECRLASQFDLVVHYDRTSALEPLVTEGALTRRGMPETFPSGQ